MKAWAAAGAAVLLLNACADPLRPDFQRVLGTITLPGSPTVIETPETVQAGTPFAVSIRTYGNGCREAGDTEVAGTADAPIVLPHDLALRRSACQNILRGFDHTVELTFTEAGGRTIAFRGISGLSGDTITLTRTVVVED